MKKFSFLFFLLAINVCFSSLFAQGPEQYVKVMVAPDHSDWLYKKGESVKFSVQVFQNGSLVKNVSIKYQLGPEQMLPVKKDSLIVAEGKMVIDGGTLKTAGFLRCYVTATIDGKQYMKSATAGFEPSAIQPVAENPKDFEAFWDSAKSELSRIPLDMRMTLIPEKCTENVNVYHISIQNTANSRIYGILCVPKEAGKYPALLRVPGAGVRPYNGDIALAEKGIITLEIGIHGIPVNLDPMVYTSLGAGALNGYWNFNMDNKNEFYFKRVYLGCVRANDLLVSLPQYDGEHLAVTGGSQGGALSIITAGLDQRVKYLASLYPALCDLTGYLKGRAGGWPKYFKDPAVAINIKDKVATTGYYDVVNFARLLKVPGLYTWGFNDDTCPPTSMYAAYNVITAPKSLKLYLETGHWNYPEQVDSVRNWLVEKLLAH